MKEYIRCKVCGYLCEAGKAGDVCPACGVPKTAFEAYKPNVSEKRKLIMDLHIHPIIIHFPQAFVLFSLFLVIVIPFLGGALREAFVLTAKVLITFLPLCVLGGFVSGLYAGKVRFKKVKTPILRTKMSIGISFFAISLMGALVIQLAAFSNITVAVEIVLMAMGSMCAGLLGKLGGSLLESKMPG